MNQHEPHLNLFNDLNSLVKIVKYREENHLSLVQYISKMSQPDLDNNVFLDEELKQHKKFSQDLLSKENRLSLIEAKLNNRWCGYKQLSCESMRLLRKSSLRILQICQSAIQKMKVHQELYEYQFKIFKGSFLKYHSENNMIQLIDLITSYSLGKMEMDKNLLRRLVEMIENGEKQTIKNAIEQRYQFTNRKIQQEKFRLRKIKEDEIRVTKERLKQKQEQRIRIQQKRKFAFEAQKILNKNKKKITKFTENVLSKIYCPLSQFSKCNFAENMLYSDQQQHKQKLMKQLRQRNKLVDSQILRFISYSSRMQQKIKIFSQKQQQRQQCNSSPKLSLNYRSVSSKKHSTSNKKIQNNYSSIETRPELPNIKQIKAIAIPIPKSNEISLQCYQTDQLFGKIDKNILVQSLISQKVEQTNIDSSLKSISILDTLKYQTERRKQSIPCQGLPQINMCERVSLDFNKARAVLHSRNNPKVLQFNQKSRRRSETPQMPIPLIQISIPNKYSLKVSKQQIPETTYNLRKLIKS